jgi:hypothetical protein
LDDFQVISLKIPLKDVILFY